MNLTVASSPHIRGDFKTSRIMLDVVLALMPALVVGVIVLGIRAAVVTLISVAAAVPLNGSTPRLPRPAIPSLTAPPWSPACCWR